MGTSWQVIWTCVIQAILNSFLSESFVAGLRKVFKS